MEDITFSNVPIIRQNNRDTFNLGIGYRHLVMIRTGYMGLMHFMIMKILWTPRWSIGTELRSSAFEVNANKYFAISGAKTGRNGNTERALDGYEIEIGGQVPYVPSAKVFAKQWKWEGYQTSDTKGKTYSLQINAPIAPNITLEAGTKDFDTGTDVDFVNLTYHIAFGGDVSQQDDVIPSLIADQAFNTSSMKDKMLEKVRRKNQIVIQTNFTASAGGI